MVQPYIRPCVPTLRRAPPSGPEWVHEVKWDGWRVQIHKDGSKICLYSRPGNDISGRFPAIADAIGDLRARSLILDGELVAFGEDNRPNFHLLRSKRPAAVAWLFDILSIDGTSLRRLPWFERRRRLERVMAKNRTPLLQLNDVWEDGETLLRACTEQDLEGIVSKLRSAPYVSGTTDVWLKVKVEGWTEAGRGRFNK